MSGIYQAIPDASFLDIRGGLQFGGKESMTLMHFEGHLVNDLDRNARIRNYAAGHFDGNAKLLYCKT